MKSTKRRDSAETVQKLKLVVFESRIFLYLPLYYACQKDWFNFLPPGYKIDIIPSVGKTDKSAFAMLMSDPARYGRVDFALADPTTIMDHYPFIGSKRPAVIASMISNTAFWAVNHGALRSRNALDLANFNKIITFGPGTTSYGIASGILRRASRDTTAIYDVDPTEELAALRDAAHDTVCLSPDILGIEQLLHNYSDFEIELALGTTPEFDNVLETALITRTDVLADHGPLVDGMLKALQYALIMVRIPDPGVVQYANDMFLGNDEERVRAALNRASDARVYPNDIEVREACWMKAAEVAAHADSESFTARKRQVARDVYDSAIAPHLSRSNRAVRAALQEVRGAVQIRDVGESRWTAIQWASGGVLFAGILLTPVFNRWLDWATLLILGVVVILTALSRRVVTRQLGGFIVYAHYALCVLIALFASAVFADLRYHGIDEFVKWGGGVVITLILTDAIGVVATAAFGRSRLAE